MYIYSCFLDPRVLSSVLTEILFEQLPKDLPNIIFNDDDEKSTECAPEDPSKPPFSSVFFGIPAKGFSSDKLSEGRETASDSVIRIEQ